MEYELSKELLVEAIANYCVVEGSARTVSCNRYIEFSEITEHFNISQEQLDELKDDIVDELYSKEQICDSEGVILEDDAFNLLFWGNYCDVDCEEA